MKIRSFLTIGGCLAVSVIAARADSMKEVSINFTANTRDLHVRMAGTPTGDPRSTDLSKLGAGYQSENTSGAYNASWTTPPGAGSYTFTFKRPGVGGWNLRYTLTTDGDINATFDTAHAISVADMSIGNLFGGTAAYADNSSGSTPVTFSDITATVVTGLNTFDPTDWDTATGTTYTFADVTAAAGQDTVLAGTLPTLAADQWVRLDYLANGVAGQDGYTAATPEPRTTTLLLCGLVLVSVRLWKRRTV
jgi:hypothetical protein